MVSPNNPPWSSSVAFGVWLASVLSILLLPGLFLIPYLISQGVDEDKWMEAATSDPGALFVQLVATIPAHLLTLLIAWLVVTHGRTFSFRRTLGFERGGFRWWHYCVILGGFYIVAFAVLSVFPAHDNEMMRILASSRGAVYLIAFLATFTAPIVEEVVYRGVLYSAFQRTIGVTGAFVLVTALFALVHVPQYYPSYSTMFLLTLISVILTLIRVTSGNLLPCIILHTIFNGLQSIFLILEPLVKESTVREHAASFIDIFK